MRRVGTPPPIAAIERATTARILVAITFQYNADRLEMLSDVMRMLAEFPVASMRVVLVTNTADHSKLDALTGLGNALFQPDDFAIASFPSLEHPLDLTWSHKSVLTRIWRDEVDAFTHFIYLEGDIALTFVNFCYWIDARETLRQSGLLPAYVRVEHRKATLTFTCSDSFSQIHIPFQANIETSGQLFFNMPNPYNPLYILDADLVQEYMASDSFGMDTSLSVCRWGKAERAAMGLCLDRVPQGFASRYVVPVTPDNRIPAYAWVSHLPNNYANSPDSPLGKIPVAALATGASDRGIANPWSTAEALLSQAQDVDVDRLYYLITVHDTVLFYDRSERALKHAPLGIAPLHTCAELRDQRVRLWVASVDSPQTGLPPQWFAALDYEMRWFADETIALFADDSFVGADWDGYARHNRPECRQWEKYRLIRVDTLAGLSVMRQHRWRSDADSSATLTLADQPIWLRYRGQDWPSEASPLAATLAPGAQSHRLGIGFGPASVQLIGLDRVIRTHRATPDSNTLPDSLQIHGLDGTWHGFTRIGVDAGDDVLSPGGGPALTGI